MPLRQILPRRCSAKQFLGINKLLDVQTALTEIIPSPRLNKVVRGAADRADLVHRGDRHLLLNDGHSSALASVQNAFRDAACTVAARMCLAS